MELFEIAPATITISNENNTNYSKYLSVLMKTSIVFVASFVGFFRSGSHLWLAVIITVCHTAFKHHHSDDDDDDDLLYMHRNSIASKCLSCRCIALCIATSNSSNDTTKRNEWEWNGMELEIEWGWEWEGEWHCHQFLGNLQHNRECGEKNYSNSNNNNNNNTNINGMEWNEYEGTYLFPK